MRQILHTYKLRLTNLSQANRSLRLGRLSKRRDIDLRDLGFVDGQSAEELLGKLIGGKDLRLLNKPDPRHEPTNLVDRRLNQIYRSVRTLFEETGTYDLFLGYPFVEGKFLDGTIVRCPVLLFPVRLIRNLQSRPRWQLEVLSEEPVSFNKTFLLAYEQFQQVQLPEALWEEEVESNKDWREWVNVLYQKVKTCELEVNFNPRLFDLKLEQVEDYLKATMDEFGVGKLSFRSQAVLGIFPQSDSALMQDYEQIEQKPTEFDLEELFGRKLPPPTSDSYIREEDRYFVSEVDQSQESALLQVKHGQSLVIHGPPGTGKSQVIVNLIADAMAHGKRVLIVSQKRAALDVVYRRLSSFGLGRFATLVHDYRHDRSSIFQKIKRQIEDIPQFEQELRDLNGTQQEHDYKLLSRQVDQISREYEELFQQLTQRERFGVSLHELYLASNPQAAALTLGESVRSWNLAELEIFLGRLAEMWDYADLMEGGHPWKERLSFHHHRQEDRERILGELAVLPDQIESLHQTYRRLSKQLSTRILEQELNRNRIAAFRTLDGYVQDHSVREGMEAIHVGPMKADQVKETLDKFEAGLKKLDARELLDDDHWMLYAALLKHTKAYKDQHDKSLRYFSLSYQRARWFWKKLLERHQLELELRHIRRLEKEVKAFQQVHRLYARVHDQLFWADFPLFGPQAEKWEWLAQRREIFAAYEHMQAITYFRKHKPRFHLEQFDQTSWQQSLRVIGELEAFEQARSDTRRSWQGYLHPAVIETLEAGIKDPQEVQSWLKVLPESFSRDFADLVSLDALLANLSARERQLLKEIQPLWEERETEAQLLQSARNSVYLAWIEQAEQEHPILAAVSGRSWARKHKEYASKLDERRNQVASLIQRRMKERILDSIEYNRLQNPITYRTISHQVSKKRRLWSVRRLVQECWEEGLWQLMPCWMASPESVAAIFPMEKDFFDLVVFDEASQCFVERAIPVMLRGKQSVIAGDAQQLQPLNLYQVRYEEGEAPSPENEIALEVESVLDLAKTSFIGHHLNWHYRSQEEELINFSNHAFYEGKLQVMPPARHDAVFQPPLEWVAVAGEWRNNRNRPEAERVLEIVMDWVRKPDAPSLGIVTFNFHQQELIRDLLDELLETLAGTDQAGYECLQRALYKTEQEEFQGLFVKNIENVQGDERDIIIFSVGYGYNEKGRLSTNFGLLNQRGGENRLNVAISRAKRKSYVVCSFPPGELRVENATHAGPKLFRDYLRFALAVSEGREQDALLVLNQQNDTDLDIQMHNRMADEIANVLREKGYVVERNVGDTTYRLDLAVKATSEAGEYLLGIECEGGHYFSGESSKERELYRRSLLEYRGWKLHRVWARNYWLDREKEIARIVDLL